MKKIIQSLLILSLLFTGVVNAGNPLFDAGIRSLDKKFSYYDKEVKKAKYGNAQWQKRVASKKNSIEKAIKKLEKKWSKEDLSAQWAKLDERNKQFEARNFFRKYF